MHLLQVSTKSTVSLPFYDLQIYAVIITGHDSAPCIWEMNVRPLDRSKKAVVLIPEHFTDFHCEYFYLLHFLEQEMLLLNLPVKTPETSRNSGKRNFAQIFKAQEAPGVMAHRLMKKLI